MSLIPIRMALLPLALALYAAAAHAQDEDEAANARSRQVLACEEAARLSIDRDRLISRSIAGAQEPDPFSGGGVAAAVGSAGSFPSELSKYEEERRRRRLIDDCVARAGAAAPEE